MRQATKKEQNSEPLINVIRRVLVMEAVSRHGIAGAARRLGLGARTVYGILRQAGVRPTEGGRMSKNRCPRPPAEDLHRIAQFLGLTQSGFIVWEAFEWATEHVRHFPEARDHFERLSRLARRRLQSRPDELLRTFQP